MKHLPSSLHLLSLAAASLLTTGCITVTDGTTFQPFGSEVTVSGEWDVDGAAPSVASCGNIATVRALVCETSAGTNCVANSSLTFPCATGAFDTRPTAILNQGTYFIVWEALSNSGALLQESNPTRLDAFGSHALFPIPDFSPATVFDPSGTAVSLSGTWDVNGAAPTAQSCGDIATVRVVICQEAAATTCWTAPSLTFPCVNGQFDTRPTRVLAAGAYHSLWEALDASGNVIQETNPLPLVVTSVSHATLASPDFDGALPATTLTVQVRFQNAAAGPFLTCSAANIATNQFEYTFHEGTEFTDPIIAGPTTQNCGAGSDVLFTENASFQFDNGSYTFFASAEETVSNCTSLWDAKCTFTLTLNTSNVVTCNASVVSSGPGC